MKYIFQITIIICATHSLFASESLLEKKILEKNKALQEVRIAKHAKEQCLLRAGIGSAVAACGWASGHPLLYLGITFAPAGIYYAVSEHNQQKEWQAKKEKLEVEIATLQSSAIKKSTLSRRKPHQANE